MPSISPLIFAFSNKKGQHISYSFKRSCNHLAEIKKLSIEELATNMCKLVLPKITSRTCTDTYLGKAKNDKVYSIKYDELEKTILDRK